MYESRIYSLGVDYALTKVDLGCIVVVYDFTLVDYIFTLVEYNLILVEYKLILVENIISFSRI